MIGKGQDKGENVWPVRIVEQGMYTHTFINHGRSALPCKVHCQSCQRQPAVFICAVRHAHIGRDRQFRFAAEIFAEGCAGGFLTDDIQRRRNLSWSVASTLRSSTNRRANRRYDCVAVFYKTNEAERQKLEPQTEFSMPPTSGFQDAFPLQPRVDNKHPRASLQG